MRQFLLAACGLLLVATQLGSAESPGSLMTSATDLLVEPGGQRVAVLLPGATVRTLETRAGWSHVSVDGWIRSDDAEPATGSPAPPPSQEAPVALEASLGGLIFVTDPKGRTAVGSHVAVRLLSDSFSAAGEIAPIRAECDSARAALKAEAAALKDRGERAMKTIENPSRAFEAYDEAKRQRAEKLRAMRALDEQCDSRVEKAYETGAVARALSNGEGRFVFDRVPPGRHTLVAALEADGMRHEWEVEVVLSAGQRLDIDLTNGNRTRSTALPVYR